MDKVRKAAYILLTLLWMAVIFGFSAGTGTDSGGLSGRVIERAGEILISDFSQWTEAEKGLFVEAWQLPVRKAAHITEYAILSILLWNSFRGLNICRHKREWLSLGAGVLYACSDELHQLFVPGRSGNIFDVMVDSAGVIAGVIFCIMIAALKAGIRKLMLKTP